MRALSSMILPLALLPDGSTVGKGTDEPSAIVRSFHEALASSDRAGALALLDPDAVIFEQGGAEMSRDEYIAQHLDADIEFSRETRSKVIGQRVHARGKSAWVITISETSGKFRGKEVSSRNAETMVLERKSAGWRIVHIHWSSHHEERQEP